MTPAERIEPLGPERFADAWRLSRLAFGGDPDADPPALPDGPPRGDAWGVVDARGRLLGKAVLLDYEQCWGGNAVAMGGVAGVAVHPDGGGRGVAGRLLGHLAERMQERGQAVSALFPTVLGLYRSHGWELVGGLDDTRVATRDLAPAQPAVECVVRTAQIETDAAAVRALYNEWTRVIPGPLTRRGRPFSEGEMFDCDVVALAEGPDGAPRGYVSYDRGRGYRNGEGELRVWELVARDADAARALLTSLARWAAVAATTLWRGPTDGLALLTGASVPPAASRLPWMLRVIDPVAAVAGRGFPGGVEVEQPFRVGGDRPERSYVLTVWDGRGSLEEAAGARGPRVHERGLALLYAGRPTAQLARAGLMDTPAPLLDLAFGGPEPVLLDYF